MKDSGRQRKKEEMKEAIQNNLIVNFLYIV
jgi:hypothetical protein